MKKIIALFVLITFVIQSVFVPMVSAQDENSLEATNTMVTVENETPENSENNSENTAVEKLAENPDDNSEATSDSENSDLENSETENAESLTEKIAKMEADPMLRSAVTEPKNQTGELKVQLSIVPDATNEDDSPKTEYWSNEDFVTYFTFKTSSDSVQLRNAKTRITVPKRDISTVNPGKAETSANFKKTEDEENYYYTYTFDSVNGGQLVSLPLGLSFAGDYKATTTTLKYELLSEDDSVAQTATLDVSSKTKPIKAESKFYVNDNYFYGSCGMSIYCSFTSVIDGDKKIAKIPLADPVGTGATNTQSGRNAPIAYYYIGFTHESNSNNLGNRNGNFAQVAVKIPDWGVFADSPDMWDYDENTRIATSKTRITAMSNYFYYTILKVAFPDVPYTNIHELPEATVTMAGDEYKSNKLYHQWNPIPKILQPPVSMYEDDVRGYILYPDMDFDTITENVFKIWYYDNKITDREDFSSNLYSIKHDPLPDYVYYKWIRLASLTPSLKEKLDAIGFKVYAVKNDDSEVHIGNYDPNDPYKNFEINDESQQYKNMIIRFNQPLVVDNEYIDFHLKYLPTSTAFDDLTSIKYVKGFIWYATFEYSYNSTDNAKKTGRDSDTKQLSLPNLFANSSSNTRLVYSENNIRLYGISIYWNYHKIKNYQKTVLLPRGFEYVKNSLTYVTNQYKKEPRIIPNYKNTGKTALIWNFDEITGYFSPSIKLNATIYTQEWENQIEYFASWSGDQHVVASDRKYTDTLDLDDDGDVTEVFTRSVHTVDFVPPREIISTTDASDSVLDHTFSSDTIYSEINEEVFIRANVFNNSVSEANNLSMITVLPYIGDHSITPNKAGSYEDRGSQFPVKLKSSIESLPENQEVAEDWNIYYSIEPQGADIEATKRARFVTADQITDWSQVTMVKMELKPGKVLGVKERANFIMPAKIPNDQNLAKNSVARVSTAISFNGVDYADGNAAEIKIARYVISGNIFHDINKDGEKGANEKLLNNYVIALRNEANAVIATTTSTDGNYSFNIFSEGKYYVEITHKWNHDKISPVVVTTTTGNHATANANPRTSRTALVEIVKNSDTTHSAVKNFGIDISLGTLTIHKVNENNQNLSGVTFRLEKNSQKIGTSHATNAEGKIILPDLEFGTYSIIEETTLPEYRLDSTPRAITINEDNLAPILKITNQKQLWNIKIVKTKTDGSRLAGATFELRKTDGTRVGNPQITPQNGEIIFTGIEYGDYRIVETSAPAGYREAAPINVSRNSFEKNKSEILLNVVNENQLWNVKIIKKDESGAPLAGATFALQDANGNQIGAAKVTPQNGEIIFENITRGDYKIVEVSAPAGYIEAVPVNISADRFLKNIQEIAETILNKKQLWNVKIIKVDENQNRLAGATFELQDQAGRVIGQPKITSQNGEIIFENIEYGEYRLIEKSAPAGYIESLPITISPQKFAKNLKEISMTVINKTQFWDLKVLKTQEDGTPLAGATFELRKKDGIVISSAISNDSGEIIFAKIPREEYVLVETSAPLGYIEANPVEIAVSEFQKNIANFTKKIINKHQLWNVKIVKKDADNGRLLAGAEFELRDPAGKAISPRKKTNQSGEIIFENIIRGDYKIVETSAPAGYYQGGETNLSANDFDKKLAEISKTITNKMIPIVGPGGSTSGSPVTSIVVDHPTTGGIDKPLFSAPSLGGQCVSAVTNIDDPKVDAYYSVIGADDVSDTTRFLSRAEFLKLLLNAGQAKVAEISDEEKNTILSTYQDVDANAWYAKYIAYATREGIMSGQEIISGKKIFRPDSQISRAEASKILTQVTLEKETKLPTTIESFIDVDQSNTLARYIENAYKTCLLHGTNARNGQVLPGEPGRKFSPIKSITLGETAKILYNMTYSTLGGAVNNVFATN